MGSLTLSESVEFAHESAENERWFREIVDQVWPHAAECNQDVRHCQIDLEK